LKPTPSQHQDHPRQGIEARAQEHAAQFPALLAEAQKLAASVVTGTHGRRQAGTGEEFWQFRNALPGDAWQSVDWRRSARSDTHYIRQHEWQAAQSVLFWIDHAKSMSFSGHKDRPDKATRATLLGLAVMILLLRAGERVGLIGANEPPKSGQNQINRMVAELASQDAQPDYGSPAAGVFQKGGRAVFLSDFLGDQGAIATAISRSADRGVRGCLVQILDPQEEAFPFDGRTEFFSMAGSLRFETLRARGLRAQYLDNLAAHKAALQDVCKKAGWYYLCHHTDDGAQSALMWLYTALEEGR